MTSVLDRIANDDGDINAFVHVPRARAMEQACRGLGIECQSWVSRLDAPGAHLEDNDSFPFGI